MLTCLRSPEVYVLRAPRAQPRYSVLNQGTPCSSYVLRADLMSTKVLRGSYSHLCIRYEYSNTIFFGISSAADTAAVLILEFRHCSLILEEARLLVLVVSQRSLRQQVLIPQLIIPFLF